MVLYVSSWRHDKHVVYVIYRAAMSNFMRVMYFKFFIVSCLVFRSGVRGASLAHFQLVLSCELFL